MTDSAHSTTADQTRAAFVASLIAGSLVAFGLLCWIAANWSGFHRFTKLELVAAALLLSAGVATVLPRLRIPALLLSVTATGGLLALIGQIYPSGADAWQLFAFWAALALPLALAARNDSLWSFWAIVAATAIILWRFQERGNGASDWLAPWLMSGALAAFLWPAPWTARWRGASRWAFRIAALSLMGLVTGEVVLGFLDNRYQATIPGLAVLAATAVILARMRPLDLGLLAANALAIDIVVIGRIAIALTYRKTEADAILLIGLIAAGIIAVSVFILRRIAGGSFSPENPTPASDAPASFSWPLVLLSGLGALIAAVPFVAFYWLVFESFIKAASGAAMLGTATLAAAIVILRGGASLGFRQMFGLIAALVGLILIGQAAVELSEKNAGFILCATLAATALVVPAAWARTVFGFAAALALVASVYMRAHAHIEYAHLAVMIVVAASAATLVAARRDAGGMHPFLSGWVAAMLVGLLLLAGRPFLLGAGVADIFDELFRNAPKPGVRILSMALAVAAAALVFGMTSRWRNAPAFALGAVAIAYTWWSPFLGPALFVFACAFVAGARVLAIAAALAVLWVVSAAYYALNWTLTDKAWTMIGLGLFLGLVTLIARRRAGAGTGLHASAPPLVAGLLIAIGVAITGGVAGAAVAGAENVIRNGRQIFIALRPVDPRSLVQGDYMAIAFDTSGLPGPDPGNRVVRAVANLDSRSVATLRLPPPESADAIDVTLRMKSRRWFVGSDAWFFEEGQSKTFEAAKFGIFRVGADGRLLLVGLADKDLKPLSTLP